MILKLKQLFDITGEKQNLNYDLVMEQTEYDGLIIDMPIKISGTIQNRADVVTLVYNCKFSLTTSCDRCLEDVYLNFEKTFEHILIKNFESESSEQNDDFILCEGETLDFDNLAITDIILSLPTKILCEKDCKGLCCDCGINLNKHNCNCNENKIDPRLLALKDLL